MKILTKKFLMTLSASVFVFSLQNMTAYAQFTDVYSGGINYTPLTDTIFNNAYSGSSYYSDPAVSTYVFPSFSNTYSGSSAYTNPTISSYNYSQPAVTNYTPTFTDIYSGSSAYTNPVVSSYNYSQPAVTNYIPTFTDIYSGSSAYTNPVVSSYNYSNPTVSNYSTPAFTDVYSGSSPYTSPTVTNYNYADPVISPYNYSQPVVTDYTPTYSQPYGSSYVPSYNYNYPSLYNYGASVVPVGTYGSNISVSWNQQTQTCWNGTVIPVGQSCPAQTQVCPNGSVISIGSVCPATTQTCWNGSVIPTTQACPAQPNYIYTPTYVAPVVYTQPTSYYTQPSYYVQPNYVTQNVTVNNVVTGVPTQISNTSAKCNGIGLIANGLSSTGWFEYGETPALGRTTQSVNIGNYHTSPFSNVLANLKPNTTYYCRAGMSNSYGTVRGEIVKFTTKGTAVSYVKETYVAKTTHKSVAKKNTGVCTNESGNFSEGQKAVTLVLEKTKGDTNIKSDVTYTLTYNNTSSSNLKDVIAKVVLPQEFGYISSTGGNYDEETRTLTINIGSLGALSQGSVNITANVSEKSQIGKTVITSGYMVYTVSDSVKIVGTQDEITTYVLGTIMPSVDKTNLGAKKVIGKDDGISFLPNSFVEWIALLAIIFILIVLGRSIYATYQEDKKK